MKETFYLTCHCSEPAENVRDVVIDSLCLMRGLLLSVPKSTVMNVSFPDDTDLKHALSQRDGFAVLT